MEEKRIDIDESGLSPAPDMEERLIAELVRMGRRRHAVPCPDAEAEWGRVALRLQDEPLSPAEEPERPAARAAVRRLRLWAVAATAAAAALACALIVSLYTRRGGAEGVVALAYDGTPQRVTLKAGGDSMVDLSSKDSITYYGKALSGARRQPRQQQLSTPRGMDFKVVLPDGSEVWLNAESTIKFPSSFIQGERRVELNGEAYFKVARNAAKPFLVTTERMNVRVLGTEFNMRSYKAEAPNVSLVKGSVLVINPETGAAECRLKPGQNAWRDSKGTLHVGAVDTYGVTQWTEGFFYFDDVPLVNILRELGRWYNLGVVFKRPAAASLKLHFSASRQEGISEALASINNMLDVSVTVEGTDIVVR